jgi:tetratricopeptide (TPR) repeat protein
MEGAMSTRFIAVGLLLAALSTACSSIRHFQPGYASFERGLALFDQGRFEEAIPHFQKATADNPEFGEAYLYLGRSYLNTRRWRDAIQPLRAAYRLSPAATRDEVFNLLLDALLAAGSGSLPGDRSRAPDRLQDAP